MKTVGARQLIQASPGTNRALTILRYGKKGRRPKVYLQAGLHADEAPGFLVLHHLSERLDEADGRGNIPGEIVVVPAANPIGLGQWRDDALRGRFSFSNSVNFNRQHPDLATRVAEEIKDSIGTNAEHNTELIRTCIGRLLETIEPEDEAAHLKHLLYSLCYDADIVFDLHCDNQAVMHVYLGTPLWPEYVDLSAQLGAEVTLLATDSGGTPFDEAAAKLWWELAARFPEHPIPSACLAATLEFRGICDTDHTTAARDAANIFAFLQRRGAIDGTPPPLPPLLNEATPLTGVDYVKTETPGVIVFFKEPGDRIRKGEVIAEIVNPLPDKEQNRVRTIRSATDGVLFARAGDRFARPGRVIAKIAGAVPLREPEGNLLTL